MKKLIVNTANDELFIVLKKDNEIFSTILNSKMHHNETMLPAIDKMLNENGVKISEIDEFGVTIGPGSFTGIRVGIATIKAFRDATKAKAKGINNLKYLFELAKAKDPNIKTVAINGSKDSYFVAKYIHDILYIYERNLTLNEVKDVSNGESVGMFKNDENLKCLVVEQNSEALLKCFKESSDETLVPVYYQLSQAENEKLKRSEVKIEVANEKDVDNISVLEKENILFNSISKDQIESAVKNENYFVLKAVVDNQIVGFVILQKTDELNIDSIVVNKEFRNLGIASRLIEKSKEIAKENSINTLSLEVAYKNITAYLLYKKLGFTERRKRKNYYVNGDDAIEMIKKI